MSAQPPGPTLRLTEDMSYSAHQLEDGILIPKVLEPLLSRWSEAEVVISDGEHERILPIGALTSQIDPDAEWESDPAWGKIQMILWREIRLDGVPQACISCGGTGSWHVEWVTGAIEATGTAECRACWHRDQGPWVLSTIRVMAEQYRGERGPFHADPPQRPSRTTPSVPYRSCLDGDEWQEPWLASYD